MSSFVVEINMTELNDGSKKQTMNGWKYLSFVLMGILAFGVTVTTLPKAVAVPPEGGTGDQMMMLLTQIQEAVFGIEETVESQSNHVQRGQVKIDQDVDSGFWLLGEESDNANTIIPETVYSGHITLLLVGGIDEVELKCFLGDIDEDDPTHRFVINRAIASVGTGNFNAEAEFNCNGLELIEADTDGTPTHVVYAMEYRVTEEAEEVGTP